MEESSSLFNIPVDAEVKVEACQTLYIAIGVLVLLLFLVGLILRKI